MSLLAYMTGESPHPYADRGFKRPSIGPGGNPFRSEEEDTDARRRMEEIEITSGDRQDGYYDDHFLNAAQPRGEAGLAISPSGLTGFGEQQQRAGAHRILPPPPLPPSAYGFVPPPMRVASIQHSPTVVSTIPVIEDTNVTPISLPQPAHSLPPSYPSKQSFNTDFRYPSTIISNASYPVRAAPGQYFFHDNKESTSVAASGWPSVKDYGDVDPLVVKNEEEDRKKKQWKKGFGWGIIALLIIVAVVVGLSIGVNKKNQGKSSIVGLAGSNSSLTSTTNTANGNTDIVSVHSSSTSSTSSKRTTSSSSSSSKVANTYSIVNQQIITTSTTTTKPRTTTTTSSSKSKAKVIATTTTTIKKSATTTVKAAAESPSVTCIVPVLFEGFQIGAQKETLKAGSACPTATSVNLNAKGGNHHHKRFLTERVH